MLKKNKHIVDLILEKFYIKNTKQLLTEAESKFKGGILSMSKTKAQWFWLHNSLPAMVDIKFSYKVTFDLKAITEDFNIDGKLNLEEFYTTVVKKNFSERNIWIKAKGINVAGFKVEFALYNSEATDKTLNPKRSKVYGFTHTITLQALDKTKVYKKDVIAKIAQDFATQFEKVAYSDTQYYKITK